MPKLKVSLSIGYPGATHQDVLEIDNDEWSDCETDEEREKVIDEAALAWAWNYIELGAEIID